MKILHIGWWMTPYRYGGAVNVALTLMKGQLEAGCDVYYFCSGRYNLLKPKPYIREWTKNGIRIFELVNSPNLIGSHTTPLIHCEHPEVERHFANVLEKVRPGIVHIHELEALSASLINVAKSKGYPTIMFLRNYWPLCSQRDLMDSEGNVCLDFMNGEKCMECRVINCPPKIAWMILGYTRTTPVWPIVNPVLEIARKGYNLVPKRSKRIDSSLADQYLYRRTFFVESLNKADILLPISKRTKEIYETFGVNKKIMKVFPSFSGAIEIISPKPIRSASLPVSFGYIGGINLNKGVHILIKAFRKLPQDKARLLIYGKSTDPAYFKALQRESTGLNMEFRGPYSLKQINQVFSEIDTGVIPSIWEEAYGLVGQEFLAARIPVIGSKIGGVPDYIIDGENGFLVKPGDIDELTEKMLLFIERPELIQEMQQKTHKPTTIKSYVSEIAALYASIT